MCPNAARGLLHITDDAASVLAIEALVAAQGLEFRRAGRSFLGVNCAALDRRDSRISLVILSSFQYSVPSSFTARVIGGARGLAVLAARRGVGAAPFFGFL